MECAILILALVYVGPNTYDFCEYEAIKLTPKES